MQKGAHGVDVAKAESLTFGLQTSGEAEAERALVEAAQRGDQGAFSELVRLYDRSVLRIALRVLRSTEAAQDAYQEAFLKAWRKLDSFRFQCRFHTWLYRIATNVCLDHLRRQKARPEFTLMEAPESGRPSLADTVRDRAPANSPERMLESREIADRIEEALDLLSERERLVFTLRHYEGMRLKAIGEACSISEESAKQCLFRATRKLRKELQDVRA